MFITDKRVWGVRDRSISQKRIKKNENGFLKNMLLSGLAEPLMLK